MLAVGRPVPQNLGPEVPHIQTEYVPFADRPIPAGRRPDPTLPTQIDSADTCQSPPEVRVFPVKVDRLIESADSGERLGADGEIPAVQDGPDPQRVVKDR